MGFGSYVLTVGVLSATLLSGADRKDEALWDGMWQGELNGRPAVTVTLGRDGGNLEGTIVFDMVSREGGEPHVIGHDAHVMIHMRVDSDGLVFEVFRRSDAKNLHLTMRFTGDDRAVLECSDCGGPPSVPLLRIK